MLYASGTIQGNLPGQNPGWYSLRFCDDFSKYYAWMYNINWNIPLNGCHLTFIAGNRETRIVKPRELERHHGIGVLVGYDPIVHTNGETFWINCEVPYLDKLRNRLGLGNSHRKYYHITLGNFKNG